ncbi:Heavy metal RND efflux membrane fusion protein, CzcB family (plasmid) [Magnetospirillum sp. XM-1]|uniref:efflux RND transporter periplasmic adaptor subunit n=1 Tax=Magnetospirillum sp. XM-1 TaxID=1663591 RepID=UPI00073DF5EF|nr:efflux RND transporter periplasmic adaptor subunit [Magnetospirillum sp. XM-1]CUW42002.1 Heavy metal RND efflux membrane fusion protein, CzcB family [Magnetospirillum sp. XM-1]
MSATRALLLGSVAVVAALGGGYWLGRSGQSHQPLAANTAPPPAATGSHTGHDAAAQVAKERQILFYQHPDGSADYSPTPKKDAKGRDYIPVYADPEPEPPPAGAGPQTSSASPKPVGKGKILYYRNAMGLPDTSPVPKKDSMGMEYVPVYEGEDDGTTLKVSLDKVQKLGVRTEAAKMTTLARSIRAVGSVQVDERNLHVVASKFEGYIERLNVNQTGQAVKRGQSLMEVYSPDLVLAQREFLVAATGAKSLENASPEAREAARSLADGALARLKNWDIPTSQIEKLRQGGQITRTLSFASPASGIVLEKRAVQGMRFMPGEMLYQIADLSTVWVIAEVFEQDLAQVNLGQTARVNFNALPGLTFTGKVTFLYPTVTPETRTAKVRIELPNHDGHLKPALYGAVELASPVADHPVLTIPDSAVLDSGTKQAVLVEKGEGRFEPREVKSGARTNGLIEIKEGLAEGEKVVIRANFLIDAESNLRAALQSFHSH